MHIPLCSAQKCWPHVAQYAVSLQWSQNGREQNAHTVTTLHTSQKLVPQESQPATGRHSRQKCASHCSQKSTLWHCSQNSREHPPAQNQTSRQLPQKLLPHAEHGPPRSQRAQSTAAHRQQS